MAVKKSDLYSSLRKSCDELRGGMDASQYKDYVLTFLFVKYVSDKYANNPQALIDIPTGASFQDMVELKHSAEIGDQINKIVTKIKEANGLDVEFADFNDEEKLGKGKDMIDRLSNLVAIFENPALNFSGNRADGDDILGDAYEYLMRHFATESGKSKGQFYTPAEVSRILAKVIDVSGADSSNQTVYDPTCGSGSLLLKVADEASVKLTLFGQEKDNATKSLAVMNMWLHGYESAEIAKGNTLAQPQFLETNGALKRFDYVVANPPFSYKSWSNGIDPIHDIFERFTGFGVPPVKNGDYAFLLHIIRSMKSDGKGAVILPHGVLFRGNAEATIRNNLIRKGYIKGIIGLPANLFYGTGIPACILVLDKAGATSRKHIFMIDASKGFMKDGNKNRLREQDIHKIVDVFTNQLEIPKYSRNVPLDELERNEHNLNIPRYIDTQEEEDLQDLTAHLQGGIPTADVDALNKYRDIYPTLRSTLFKKDTKPSYEQLCVVAETIKTTIFNHPEFLTYRDGLDRSFTEWADYIRPSCIGINKETKPKERIVTLGESLLAQYATRSLLDKYDIYQHLMDYRYATMKDDLYFLIEDGRVAQPRIIKQTKKELIRDCDLLPKELVIDRYFGEEKKKITDLEQKLDETTQHIEEITEEHAGDEGLMTEVTNDKGKVTKGNITSRLREIKGSDEQEEKTLLEQLMELIETEGELKKVIKEKEQLLDRKVYTFYGTLTEDQIKQLVIDDKWIATINMRISSEIDAISQSLTSRIVELAERYEQTLGEIDEEVVLYEQKVEEHLKKMGF